MQSIHAVSSTPRLTPLSASLLLALGLTATPAARAATNITVTTASDAGTADTCTLRQAINAMNADTVMGTSCLQATITGTSNIITFDTTVFPPGSGANTITLGDLPDNSLNITAPDLTIDASANGNVTIQRSRSSGDETNAFRIIYDTSSSGGLTLNNLTIRNGNARSESNPVGGGGVACYCTELTLNHSVITGNSVTAHPGFGGGVFVYGADLTLDQSTVSDNHAYGYGGGVSVLASYGNSNRPQVTITGSTISNNTNTGQGQAGGAFLDANATITGSTIQGNSTEGNGGGFQINGTLSMTDSVVSDNHADKNGGGMKVYHAITISNSTISGNVASNNGGGVYDASGFYGVTAALMSFNYSTLSGNQVTNPYGSRGGALFTRVGNLEFRNSTISGNTTTSSGFGYGAGIYVKQNDYPITFLHTTVAGNTASVRGGGLMIATSGVAPVTLNATLFANTSDPSGGGSNIAVTYGNINIDGDGNLIQDNGTINANFINTPSFADPLLNALGDYGGSTETQPVQAGSPALDAVAPVNGSCALDMDQRHVSRPQGSGCDIGATEGAYTPPPSFTVAITVSGGAGTATPAMQTVQQGQQAQLVVEAADSYLLQGVQGDTCNATPQGGNIWKTSPINADCTLTALIIDRPSLCPAADSASLVFSDDFNGAALDPVRWTSHANSGSISVASDGVSLAPGGEGFPYITATGQPIPPAGAFSVRWVATYGPQQDIGTGTLVLTDLLPANGANRDPAHVAADAWQDVGGYVVAVQNPYGTTSTPFSLATPAGETHDVEYCWTADAIQVWVDGIKHYDQLRDASVPRPSTLWFGNPAGGSLAGPWQTFTLDRVQVRALGDIIFRNGFEGP